MNIIEENQDYGTSDIVQTPQPSLFKPFNTNAIKPAHPIDIANNKSNPFTAIAANKYLKTNTVLTFDNFINTQNLNNLKQIDQKVLKNVAELEQFNGKFVILFLNVISKFYENDSKEIVLKCAQEILTTYFKKPESQFTFINDFLTQFGVLKVCFFTFSSDFFKFKILKCFYLRVRKKTFMLWMSAKI